VFTLNRGIIPCNFLPACTKLYAWMIPEESHHVSGIVLQIEALRIWRLLEAYGMPVLSIDDAFPALLTHLEPPDVEALSALAEPAQYAGPSTETGLIVSAEAYRLCAQCVRAARHGPFLCIECTQLNRTCKSSLCPKRQHPGAV
jgi:hypothetical protein